ncbi:MAG TPA: ABC transporter permease [Acidimicrobiales bacterium]|jgi:NitT/TauT family transport system permease protein|nr:ABC transporter permease [Acidimicrobiales bacterium]
MAVAENDLAAQLAGLDALDEAAGPPPSRARRAWAATWPKLAAVALAVGAWQAVVWTGWKPEYALPGPGRVFPELAQLVTDSRFWRSVGITMQRAVSGYAIAVVAGSALGLAVARVRLLRTAVGSMITGLQTMPSIAWFPLAILLFQLSERAILFVVVLGAAPSVANGLIAGVDHVPPLLLRAGHMVGARGLALYRHVVLPASLPTYVAGLKQGWAFAWRSLMAGELLVVIATKPSIGAGLQHARELVDAPGLISFMIVVLVIGILVDTVFGRADSAIRRRRGLIGPA